MAIHTLAKKLDADLWPIKIDDIIYELYFCKESSLKKCKKIVGTLYDYALNYTKKTDRPLVIWFQPSYEKRNYHCHPYSGNPIIHKIIALTVEKQLKKKLNKNIIFVTNDHPLSPSSKVNDETGFFSTVKLAIPEIDLKGRIDLLKHYFSKCELDHEVNLESLAKANLNLIRLQNIVKETEKVAQKEGATLINEEHVLQAREKCDSSYRYAQEEERKKIAEKLAQEKEEQERIAREREWEEEKKERKKQEEEWEREWKEWENQRTFTKKIIALGCVCTAGLVYLYNKICSKKDSKESKKKKSNKEEEHTSKKFECSLKDAYLWNILNKNNDFIIQ